MRWFDLLVVLLAGVGCIWLLWAYRWLGAYMLLFIAVAYLIGDHSHRFGVHPVLAVALFCILGVYVGNRLFPRAGRRQY